MSKDQKLGGAAKKKEKPIPCDMSVENALLAWSFLFCQMQARSQGELAAILYFWSDGSEWGKVCVCAAWL